MRYRRADVVDHAVRALDEHGLAELTMRRLAGELGVQPSALYHHFPSKDALLAAVADELVARGRRTSEVVTWDAEVSLVCVDLRDAMRAVRDGAELVAAVHGSGSQELEPARRLAAVLERAGSDEDLVRVATSMLVRFVIDHVDDPAADFQLGLTLLLDGLRRRLGG
ncbi:MAG TPA: TetR/AcrR family transcriptional regulator [Nocardioides sp.]|nr:TetR/AcrR family transcriptional regulator [Nocardioides sp.]